MKKNVDKMTHQIYSGWVILVLTLCCLISFHSPAFCECLPDTLDWDKVEWSAPSPYTTFNLSGVDFVFDIYDSSNNLLEIDDNTTLTGGLTPEEKSLFMLADFDNQVQYISLIINIDPPVSDLSFTLFDIDKATNDSWNDRISLYGNLGQSALVPAIVTSPANVLSGHVVSGVSNAPNTTGDGNVSVSFTGVIDQVVIVYESGPDVAENPSQQGMALHDLYFCNPLIPVEISSFIASSVGGRVVLEWTTQSETENLGFHVFRSGSPQGEFAQITSELIKGSGSSEEKHHYAYQDQTVEPGKTYYYKLANVSFDGIVELSEAIGIEVEGPPEAYFLAQNFPNPFNPHTTISFTMKKEGFVTLSIINMLGQRVKNLVSAYLGAGTHAVVWNGRDDNSQLLPGGLYVYTININGFNETRKLALLK